ncbi:hypothetical protein R3W88_019462 [Solanum pinnatisectum]|uniref:Uncharacterized protein n=1 Tax=Solanum pinnatisectum TaxID=50273 RepID=A0AAV9KMB1_9SOLN|nr:hypothetical protein R3W88_019462 [Solanum pinnatisectum]
MTKISYERVLVEVDVAQPLPDNIDISTPYCEFQNSMEYYSHPKFYFSCMMFVHDLPHCWNKIDGGVVEEEF